jgi:hypothetical protein
MNQFVSQITLILKAVLVGLLGIFAMLFGGCAVLLASIFIFIIFPVYISFPFLGVVALLLIFSIKTRSQTIQQEFEFEAKFVVSIIIMAIICIIVWQDVVTEYLYDNTDENMMGFLSPLWGDFWIGEGGFPIITVQHVVHGRGMSEPDEIKAGWSIPKLQCLWSFFVVVSLAISGLLARVPWIPRRFATATG